MRALATNDAGAELLACYAFGDDQVSVLECSSKDGAPTALRGRTDSSLGAETGIAKSMPRRVKSNFSLRAGEAGLAGLVIASRSESMRRSRRCQCLTRRPDAPKRVSPLPDGSSRLQRAMGGLSPKLCRPAHRRSWLQQCSDRSPPSREPWAACRYAMRTGVKLRSGKTPLGAIYSCVVAEGDREVDSARLSRPARRLVGGRGRRLRGL